MKISLEDLKLFAKFWFECGWNEKEAEGKNQNDRFEFCWKDEALSTPKKTIKNVVEIQKNWDKLQKI